MNTRKVAGLILAIAIAMVVLWGLTSAFYHQSASEIAVLQAPVTGELTVSLQQGMHLQYGGKVTYYPRRGQIDFDGEKDGSAHDGVLHIPKVEIRFNDGAVAHLSGSLAWEMPIGTEQIINLHKLYGSAEAIERQIIVKNIGKAAFVTGPLMTSGESYASRRNDLLNLVYDQVENGAFKTVSQDTKTVDALTGKEKTVKMVEIAMEKGQPVREDKSIIKETGLHTFNLALDGVEYNDIVKAQIANQQQSIMAIQTAIAEAKTAEQNAITTEQKGKAEAAKQKWEQEAIKAKEVTVAEKNLVVAQLVAQAELTNAIILAQKRVQEAEFSAKAALATKTANVLLGEGEAQRAQLVMQANGALEQKLAAWTAVNKSYADAIAKYTGNWVPQTVFGSGGSAVAGGGASELIQLLTAKTAKDISLDISTAIPTPTAPGPQVRK